MTPSPAWTSETLVDPHHVADKRSRVQKMFAAIAPKYDLNNRLHSFGLDQRWRKKAVKLAELKAEDRVVDVACGTGDLSIKFRDELVRLYKYGGNRPQVVGIDFTFEMLPRANTKAQQLRSAKSEPLGDWPFNFVDSCSFINGDAQALPLADASADVVSIAFGIRNVQEPAKALAEFYRVLRPGGRLIILEFSQPRNRLVRFFNDFYCNRIMPTTATWISGDKSGAYKYLPKSVETFMSREQMMSMMADAGFTDITQHPMTFGVAVVYRGYKR